MAARVREARRTLEGAAVRQRQFSGVRGAVASSLTLTLVVQLVLATVLALRSAAITSDCQRPAAWTSTRMEHPTLLPTVAAVVNLGMSVVPLVGLLRARKKLRAIARALPPLAAGAPSACRVCGGPVIGFGVVRCPFCAADNVVDAEVMRHVGEVHGVAASILDEEVRTQATAIGETRGLGFPLVASMALLPTPFIVIWFAPPLLSQINFDVDPAERFHLSERGPLANASEPHQLCLTVTVDCTPKDSRCVAHEPVPFTWLVGKTTMQGEPIVGVRENLVRGRQVLVAGGRAIDHAGLLCVAGEPSPAWHKLAAEDEERDRKRREESDRRLEHWKRRFDGGVPELRPVPFTPPDFRVLP